MQRPGGAGREAIDGGQVETAKTLIEFGADPFWSMDGTTMLERAKRSPPGERSEMISLLETQLAWRQKFR